MQSHLFQSIEEPLDSGTESDDETGGGDDGEHIFICVLRNCIDKLGRKYT